MGTGKTTKRLLQTLQGSPCIVYIVLDFLDLFVLLLLFCFVFVLFLSGREDGGGGGGLFLLLVMSGSPVRMD